MGHLLPYGGQVLLAPAFASVGGALEHTTFATSASSFSPAPQASSELSIYGDTPSALFASDIPFPASTATDFTLSFPSNDPVAGHPLNDTDVVALPDSSDHRRDSLMRKPGRKCFGGFIAIALGYITISGIDAYANEGSNAAETHENAEWIATSRNWVDRQLCRWFGLCGTLHLNENRWTWDGVEDDVPPPLPNFGDYWKSGPENPDSWSEDEKARRTIPQYVFDHAPYVHLFSGEQFWPCDLAEHLVHITPHVNYTKISDSDLQNYNLTNLHELNDYDGVKHGRFMYLKSDDNVEDRPKWLGGAVNIPASPDLYSSDNEDVTWPDPENLNSLDLESAKQQAFAEQSQPEEEALVDDPQLTLPVRAPSTNGRCGGNSGFTCKGSKFGKCCSIYGWCGRGHVYCGQACDALAGDCKDPFEPVPRPHTDLRRRKLDLRSKRHQPTPAGKSAAPAILIVVPKEDGIVDAFWFFFYSFNQGNKVLNIRFGNHVGDWEHTLIRFKDGKPESVFVSEHNFGGAYTWHAIEKYLPNPDGSGTMIGTWSNETAAKLAMRPVVYSADGSHAMYPTPGIHPYVLPWGLLHDESDRGPLWDPALNAHSYTWDLESKTLRSSTLDPKAPTEWFHFAGHWGDKYYPLSDPRQYRFAGQYHYVNGPTGPRFKRLDRKQVCAHGKGCHIRNWVGDRRVPRLQPEEEQEPGGLPGGNSTDET